MCDRSAVIYFAPLDVLLIGELGIGNWELVMGNRGLVVVSNKVILYIAKRESHLAAAGIALIHCILLAMTSEIGVNSLMPDAPFSIA